MPATDRKPPTTSGLDTTLLWWAAGCLLIPQTLLAGAAGTVAGQHVGVLVGNTTGYTLLAVACLRMTGRVWPWPTPARHVRAATSGVGLGLAGWVAATFVLTYGIGQAPSRVANLTELAAVPAVYLTSALVVSPLLEEITFRRVLQTWLTSHVGPPAAIVMAAAAFAAVHATGGPTAVVPAFIAGLAAGVAWHTAGPLAAISAHVAYNAAVLAWALVR